MAISPDSTLPEKLLLTNRQAAEILSVSPRTLWGITEPRGPIPCVRIGNRVLYPYDVLRQWLAKNIGQSFKRAC